MRSSLFANAITGSTPTSATISSKMEEQTQQGNMHSNSIIGIVQHMKGFMYRDNIVQIAFIFIYFYDQPLKFFVDACLSINCDFTKVVCEMLHSWIS